MTTTTTHPKAATSVLELNARLDATDGQIVDVRASVHDLTEAIGVWTRWLAGTIIVVALAMGSAIFTHLVDGHPAAVLREVELLRGEFEDMEQSHRELSGLVLELIRQGGKQRKDEGQ